MPKFRKKPVVIEALQLRWDNWTEMCEFASVGKLEDGKPQGCYLNSEGQPMTGLEGVSDIVGLLIPTLEGLMVARQDDWIIKGIKGELYPIKNDIFLKTYEVVLNA